MESLLTFGADDWKQRKTKPKNIIPKRKEETNKTNEKQQNM